MWLASTIVDSTSSWYDPSRMLRAAPLSAALSQRPGLGHSEEGRNTDGTPATCEKLSDALFH